MCLKWPLVLQATSVFCAGNFFLTQNKMSEGCEEAKPSARSRGWFLTINNPESNDLAQHEKELFAI